MDDKTQHITALREEFQQWQTLLASMTTEQIHAPIRPSTWTTRDVMAHLWAWQRISIARLTAALSASEPIFPDWPQAWHPDSEDDVLQINEWFYATYRDKLWPQVYADWYTGFQRLIDLAQRLPEPDLLEPGRYAWLGDAPLMLVLRGSFNHHAEHRGWLLEWLKQT
jgi:hypothetical protein